MCGNDRQNTTMFSTIPPEERVPADHPLRPIRSMVDKALKGLSPRSTSDPECRQCKKSKGAAAQLCYMGPVLMENRNGLVIESTVTQATGKAERNTAMDMVRAIPGSRRVNPGGR